MIDLKWKPAGNINNLESEIGYIFDKYFPQIKDIENELSNEMTENSISLKQVNNFVGRFSLSFTITRNSGKKIINDIKLELSIPEYDKNRIRKRLNEVITTEVYIG